MRHYLQVPANVSSVVLSWTIMLNSVCSEISSMEMVSSFLPSLHPSLPPSLPSLFSFHSSLPLSHCFFCYLIGNRFWFHKMHPNHNFPSANSTLLLPTHHLLKINSHSVCLHITEFFRRKQANTTKTKQDTITHRKSRHVKAGQVKQ